MVARGIIKTVGNNLEQTDYFGFYSNDNNFFLIGGSGSSGYSNKLWYSSDGADFAVTDVNLPFSGSKYSQMVGSGSTVYIVNGTNAAGAMFSIYSGTINTITRKIDWNATPVVTSSILFSGNVKVAYNHGLQQIYTSTGFLSLSSKTESLAPIGNGSHASGTMYWDARRQILWSSNTGSRTEYVIGKVSGDSTDYGNFTTPDVFTYRQSTSSLTWNCTHNMGANFNTALFYTSDYELLEPLTMNVTATTLTATFGSASTGFAYVLSGALKTGTSWSFSASHLFAGFIAVNSGTILDPLTTAYNSTFLNLTFTTASAGHLIVLNHPLGTAGADYGVNNYSATHKKIIDRIWANENTVDIAQFHYSLPWMRLSATFEHLEPKTIAHSVAGTSVTMNSSSNAILYSNDVRHLNMHNLQDPWDKTGIKSASLGVNGNNHQFLHVITDNKVWYSYDGGTYWTEQGSGTFAAKGTYVVANNPIVGALSSSYIPIRSVDNGATFSSASNVSFGQQVLTWHGALKETPNTNWKVFVYERPSDVIFETDYGTFDNIAVSGVLDDYSTHYVLPYDVLISSGDLNSVTFSVSSSFARDYTADEFAGDYLKISDASTTSSLMMEIDRNSEALAGQSVTVYLKEELSFLPESIDKVQILKKRPEGITYYSVISRDTNINAYIYNEVSGSKFIPSQEQAFDWYANDIIRDGLPSAIATEDNRARANLLLAESNRQRTLSNISFNDPSGLPPNALKRLGAQYGLTLDENLPLNEQRRATELWHQKINQYGACLEGIRNLANLVFGSGSSITATTTSASSNAIVGKVLYLDIRSYAGTSFLWEPSNATGFDSTRKQFYLEGTVAQMSSELQFMTHQNLYVLTRTLITDPIIINNHISEVTGIRLYFDDASIRELPLVNNVSYVCIMDEAKSRKLAFFLSRVKAMVPEWMTIKYTA